MCEGSVAATLPEVCMWKPIPIIPTTSPKPVRKTSPNTIEKSMNIRNKVARFTRWLCDVRKRRLQRQAWLWLLSWWSRSWIHTWWLWRGWNCNNGFWLFGFVLIVRHRLSTRIRITSSSIVSIRIFIQTGRFSFRFSFLSGFPIPNKSWISIYIFLSFWLATIFEQGGAILFQSRSLMVLFLSLARRSVTKSWHKGPHKENPNCHFGNYKQLPLLEKEKRHFRFCGACLQVRLQDQHHRLEIRVLITRTGQICAVLGQETGVPLSPF